MSDKGGQPHKGDHKNAPPKMLYYPADWTPLQGYAGPLRAARAAEHAARRRSNR